MTRETSGRGVVHHRAGAGAARVAVHRRARRCTSRRCRDGRASAATRRATARSSRPPSCPGAGTVWSYTDAQYQPPPPYVPRTDPYEPFALAAVELPEGIIVLGQVADGYGVADLRVGAEVELVVETLYADDDGDLLDLALEAGHRAGRGGRPVSSSDVAVLGVGMHPWGKWGRAVHRVRRARRPGRARRRRRRRGPTSTSSSAARRSATATPATSPARRSPRRSAGTAPASPRRTPPARPAPRPSTPPGPGSSPGCREVALVVGADTTPKGFLAPNAGERWDDPDWLRFRLLGMTNPAYFALYARRRMDLYGATPEDFAAGQGQERPARAGEPERPLPQGGQRRGRAGQRGGVRPAAPARHLRDLRRRGGGGASPAPSTPRGIGLDRAGAGQRDLDGHADVPQHGHGHAEPLHRLRIGGRAQPRADVQGVDRARGVRGGRHRARGRQPGRGLRPVDRARAGLDGGPRRCASAARPRRCCARARPRSAAGSRSTRPAGWPASARRCRPRRWPRCAR